MDFLTVAQFDPVKAEIQARGPVNATIETPQDAVWQLLTGKSKEWAKAYVLSGGDTRKANEAGGYAAAPHLTAKRFLSDDTPAAARMRTYVAALNDAVKRSLIEPVPQVEEQPVYLPAIIPTEIIDVHEAEKDTDKAKKVWRAAASYTPGDFMLLTDNDWEWDLEKLKNAPVGVLKGISKDGRGRTQVEFSSPLEASKALADHYKPKENEGNRVDIRSVVVNILQSGDPAERYRLDDLARKAAERLKADREKKQLSG